MLVATESRVDDLIAQIWQIMREDVYPLEPQLLRAGFGALLPTLAHTRQKIKALGLWAPHLPEAYGGRGLALPAFARISEVLGHSPLGHYVFNCQAPDVGNMEILLEHGSAEQKQRFLEPLARGEVRSCFAMTEPENPGSNPVLLDANAVKDGDDYLINGHKWFTSGADGAAFAIAMVIT